MQTEIKTATTVAAQPLPAKKQTPMTEQPSSATEQTLVHLPLGLLGFEQFKRFELVRNPAEAPFEWLLSTDDPMLGFLVISPFILVPSYQPDIDPQDTEFLQLGDPADTMVLSTVTLQKNSVATLNLKGPIVFNRHTLVGKQVVPRNAAEYSTRYPLAHAKLAYDHAGTQS
jgi:flagellar assembly factor FliW